MPGVLAIVGLQANAEFFAQGNTKLQCIDRIQPQTFVAKQWGGIINIFGASIFQIECLDNQLFERQL